MWHCDVVSHCLLLMAHVDLLASFWMCNLAVQVHWSSPLSPISFLHLAVIFLDPSLGSGLMCVLLLAHLGHGILLGCFAARARVRSLIGSGPGLIPL